MTGRKAAALCSMVISAAMGGTALGCVAAINDWASLAKVGTIIAIGGVVACVAAIIALIRDPVEGGDQ